MLVMEEIIKFDQTSPIDANTINKLYDQEKHDRIANNKKKCLETSKLIVLKFYFKLLITLFYDLKMKKFEDLSVIFKF